MCGSPGPLRTARTLASGPCGPGATFSIMRGCGLSATDGCDGRSVGDRGKWSGRRDSNPRHSAWEADTLPAELLPLGSMRIVANGCPPANRSLIVRSMPRGRLGLILVAGRPKSPAILAAVARSPATMASRSARRTARSWCPSTMRCSAEVSGSFREDPVLAITRSMVAMTLSTCCSERRLVPPIHGPVALRRSIRDLTAMKGARPFAGRAPGQRHPRNGDLTAPPSRWPFCDSGRLGNERYGRPRGSR